MPLVIYGRVHEHIGHFVFATGIQIRHRVWTDPDVFLTSFRPGRVLVLKVFMSPGMDPSVFIANALGMQDEIRNDEDILLRTIMARARQQHTVVSSCMPSAFAMKTDGSMP